MTRLPKSKPSPTQQCVPGNLILTIQSGQTFAAERAKSANRTLRSSGEALPDKYLHAAADRRRETMFRPPLATARSSRIIFRSPALIG
jgi:hypothetical protein